MIVLKLGGSVLTDKTRYKALRADDLRRLAKEVAGATGPMILVHGAGSFGHVLAREHRLGEGARTPAALAAAAHVHADVRELHAAVLAALREAGLAPFGIAPWSVARLREGALAHLDLSAMLLAPRGTLPVSFGDVVPDDARGVGILSGDDVVREAALALAAAGERVEVVFAMAADGVLDSQGRLVGRLAPGVSVPQRTGGGADVTGGIVKKVEVGRALAEAGARVRFVNGLAPGRVGAAVRGLDVPGTEIE